MSKERLEEIKERYMEHEYDYALSAMDIDWLIEQAERVQEYEYTQKYEDKLIKQNKRYREALEFYANQKHVRFKFYGNSEGDIIVDYGETARKALEEVE